MPIMDGFEATKQIRALPGRTTLPIIAMTAAAMKQDKEATSVAGMNDHISKPIDFEELAAVLNRWIKVDHAQLKSPEKNLNFEEFEGFDTNRLAVFGEIGFNRKAIIQLMRSFWTEYKNKQEILKNLIDVSKFDEALELIHSIKGASGNIGAVDLHKAAKQLEEELHENNAASYESFSFHLQKVLNSIEKLSDDAPIVIAGTCTPEESIAMLDETKGLLKQNIYITEDKLSEIERVLEGRVDETLRLALVSKIRDMDFEKALVLVETINKLLKKS